jgi:hypothetical protein
MYPSRIDTWGPVRSGLPLPLTVIARTNRQECGEVGVVTGKTATIWELRIGPHLLASTHLPSQDKNPQKAVRDLLRRFLSDDMGDPPKPTGGYGRL